MNALITWAVANPTYAFLLAAAALWLLIGCAMDEAERAQGMDAEPEPFPALAECEAIAQRVHAQMVADGLIRDPGSHTRIGDHA